MKSSSTWVVGVGLLVLAVAAGRGMRELGRRERVEESVLERVAGVSAPPPVRSRAAKPAQVETASQPTQGADSTRSPKPRRILYLNEIDDIKHEIYAREIESVDRLHLLDDLVQTGDLDTRDLWNREWGGIDDWKNEQNGFTLQRTEDGSLIFHPDPATMDLYSFYETLQAFEYDEARHEFVNEVDYYGKPIRNVLRFINEETVVMMTISGDKVDLNIYGAGLQSE